MFKNNENNLSTTYYNMIYFMEGILISKKQNEVILRIFFICFMKQMFHKYLRARITRLYFQCVKYFTLSSE